MFCTFKILIVLFKTKVLQGGITSHAMKRGGIHPLRNWMKTQCGKSGVFRGCHGNRGKFRISWPSRWKNILVWPGPKLHTSVPPENIWMCGETWLAKFVHYKAYGHVPVHVAHQNVWFFSRIRSTCIWQMYYSCRVLSSMPQYQHCVLVLLLGPTLRQKKSPNKMEHIVHTFESYSPESYTGIRIAKEHKHTCAVQCTFVMHNFAPDCAGAWLPGCNWE